MLRTLALAFLMAATAAIADSEHTTVRAQTSDFSIPESTLTPVRWADVEGWAADDHAAAFDAFLGSCRAIVAARRLPREPRPIDAPLKAICKEALALGPATANEAREFFETRFRAVRIVRENESAGFLTGYYEPVIHGSRVPTGDYKVPIYRQAQDLVPGARRVRSASASAFPNKGGAHRRVGRKLVPYFDRGEIEDGALDGKGLEIAWVKDPVDAFFMQIQGSARIRLEDGATLRLNYAAHNGFPYTPVGAHLVERGVVPREEMSMDRIRQWMTENPDGGKELRRLNRSFVFFRIAELDDHEEAVGAQGIPLYANRSIAVDRKLHAYGTPFWIDAELPLSGEGAKDRFRRLMIAQDTGSAIIGPARADIYFGAGEDQGRVAGRIKHPGAFTMLVPASIAPAPLPTNPPLPRPRPQS